MGTKHCEKKDKPIIVFKHVKRSYRALDAWFDYTREIAAFGRR